MIVDASGIAGSIGGGHLEYIAIEKARALLAAGPSAPVLETFQLGPALGQCCGGVATLLFEPVPAQELADCLSSVIVTGPIGGTGACRRRPVALGERPADLPAAVADALGALAEPGSTALVRLGSAADGPAYFLTRPTLPEPALYLFGAGHVGQALVRCLDGLPFAVHWIDSRSAIFPTVLPVNVRAIKTAVPAAIAAEAEADSLFLIMTHSHQVDFDILHAIMRRGDAGYVGLIGSATKRARFERRLLARGVSAARVEQLVCPIGLADVGGKSPAEIAVATAAQLLFVRHHGAAMNAQADQDKVTA
jgi:xanthine dehydrogenase accessory factor